jgi:hypothetical protein
MKRIITINDVKTLKSGVSNGGNWTLYAVIDENGNKYTTFSGKYLNMIGKKVEIEYETSEREYNGKKYVDYKIVNKNVNNRETEILNLLKEIKEGINVILYHLNEEHIDKQIKDIGNLYKEIDEETD